MKPGHLLLAGWLSIQALDAQTTVLTVTELLARALVAESHFTGLQKRSGRMSFTDTRELVAFNGKPAAKGRKLSKIPLDMKPARHM